MKKDNRIFFQRKFLITTNILLLLVVVFLVIFTIIDRDNNEIKHSIIRDIDDSFVLTNPILDCENDFSGEELIFQSKAINEKVSELKKEYSLEHISLYFRDMNNGPWIGINEKEEFSPASLLKVPIMMAFLREAQDDPSLLTKRLQLKMKI